MRGDGEGGTREIDLLRGRRPAQVPKGSYQLGLCILAQRVDRHCAERANGVAHLLHLGVAARAEPEMGFDLGGHVRIEHALEVVGDQFHDLLTGDRQAACTVLVFMSPSPKRRRNSRARGAPSNESGRGAAARAGYWH
jgi:hypothetical protein